VGLVGKSVKDFLADDCQSMAAALSYYTVFALPPLLALLLLIVGIFVDPAEVSGHLATQIEQFMGAGAASQIRSIVEHASQPSMNKPLAFVLSIALLIAGATGAFTQLQSSLNRAWNVAPDPDSGGVKSFLLKRLFSFGMVLVVAFLLLVSLVISTALSAFSGVLGRWLGGLSGPVLHLINVGISFAVITVLFALIYRVLPDAKVAWRDVWVGAAVTALLFTVGKFLIGLYVGRSNPGQAFGAASSMAVLLVWIYYSSMIVLFGAEFTQTWAERRGQGIEPSDGAVQVARETRTVRPSGGTDAGSTTERSDGA
jgi:membrane protein